MLKSDFGRIDIGVPKNASPQEQKAEIYADLCCLIEGISLLLGRDTTAKMLCDVIEAVYVDELKNDFRYSDTDSIKNTEKENINERFGNRN